MKNDDFRHSFNYSVIAAEQASIETKVQRNERAHAITAAFVHVRIAGRETMLEMEEAKNANFYVRELADPDPKKKVRQYVRAQQVYGEGGFTVRQRQYRNAKGQICPAYVTGGGTGDYLCQDLRDSHRFVERAQDFQAHYERVAFNKLPSGIREDLVPR